MTPHHTRACNRLTVRAKLGPDEGLHQFLSRLAALNGYPDPHWLLNAAGLPRAFLTSPCDLRPLANMLGEAARDDALAAAAYWPIPGSKNRVRFGDVAFGVTLRALTLTRAKVCPVCCQEGRFGCRTWDLFGIAACRRHGCLLRDGCSACGAALLVRGPGFLGSDTRCYRCGGAPVAEPVPAPPPVLALAGWLECFDRGRSLRDRIVPVCELDAAVHLVRFFGAKDMNGDGRRWRSSYISKPPIDEMIEVIGRAAAVLLDWPDGFIDYLERHRRIQDTRVGLAAEFGPLMVRLRAALDEPRFEAVMDLAKRHLAQSIPGPIVKPWSFFSVIANYAPPTNTGTVSGVVAARALGVSLASIARMIASGELKGQSRRMGQRQAYLVDATALAGVVAFRSASQSAAETATSLGLTAYQVERLRLAGLLRSVRGLGTPAHERRFAPADITAFIDRLNRVIRDGSALPFHTHTVTLSEVASMRSFSLVEVVKRIFSGTLPVFAAPSGAANTQGCLGKLMVSRSDLLGQRVGPSGGIAVDVRQVAKQLGVSVRMVPVLVRAGCLNAHTLGADRLARCSVSVSSVTKFQHRFVMARTLAVRHRTSPRTIAKRLAAVHVAPVVASDSRKGISAVWRREDIDAVDLGQVLLSIARIAP